MFVRPLGRITPGIRTTSTTTSLHPRPIPYCYRNQHQARNYACTQQRPLGRSVRPALVKVGRNQSAGFHTSRAACKSVTTVQKFKLADIGEGITECEVIKWSVQLGAKVAAFDPLCEVQSDKASVEITSPFDGVIKELLVKEGEIAKVGEGLCLIEVEEEEKVVDANAEAAAIPAEEVKVVQQEPIKEKTEPQQQEPPPPPPPPPTRRKHPLDPTYVPPPPSPRPSPAAQTNAPRNTNVLATPSIRHLARKKGVDLALLVGSGRGGRVEKRDVEDWIVGASASAGKGDGVEKKESVVRQEGDVVVDLGRTRYNMWKAMVKSLEIPHFGYTTTLDITALHNLLPVLNAHIPGQFLPSPSASSANAMVNPSALYPSPIHEMEQVPEGERYAKLTYLPILLKTLSKAMVEWPLFRASITPGSVSSGGTPPQPSQPTITIRPHADISIALSTPTGLYTPTLSSVDTSSIYTLASRLKRLSSLGRKTPSGLTIGDMPKRGGTITVSNVGAVGKGESAVPVLVPGSGGVAIVALGRARWVWDVEDEFWDDDDDDKKKRGERRLKLGVSWSADHRVVEGAEMAAFVESWRGWVENPQRLIGEGV